ncbi:MAG: hypothetical protein A6F71_01575 [Cycloclasticus sp. symbiont of Poecilosclerida sp. M]|nr:MAG: hypothetical protein A6F71_01575 [Cycloclasticus sp. symbiont of Poecilosclerida sp. M]
MNQFSQSIEAALLKQPSITRALIAYSGGVDSHVLLHVCAKIQVVTKNIRFSVISVDHGLHEASARWLEYCEKTADELGLEFKGAKVCVDTIKQDGVESAARKARYAAIKEFVDEHTVLLTAQHQDDQAETLLLQLFRGCGVQGLASIPPMAQFGSGFIARPFLNFGREEIVEYANKFKLKWLEDPSNTDISLNRNYLRSEVIPVIKKRWGAFSKTTSRTAEHCAEASSLLAATYEHLIDKENLAVFNLQAIEGKSGEVQRAIIRHWLFSNDINALSTKQMEQLLNNVIAVDDEKQPVLKVTDYEVRRFKNRLYLLKALPEMMPNLSIEWMGDVCQLPEPIGELKKVVRVGCGVKKECWDRRVTIKFRNGGENIKILGRSGTQKLKNLLNQKSLPFWVRERVPLVYIDDKLAAIANFWVAEEFQAGEDDNAFEISWSHPDLSF